MSTPDKSTRIIVRRTVEDEEVPKGGVWKIAHADFMTAMMAFFLVMWLISQTDQATRASVANYFNPVQLAQTTIDKKGLEEARNTPPDGKPEADKKGLEKGSGDGTGGPSHQLQKPRFKEGALFQDPYAVLARIAAEIDPVPHDPLGADAASGDSHTPGLTAGEVARDPFDPLYWQVSATATAKAAQSAKPGVGAAPTKDKLDATAAPPQAEAPKADPASPPPAAEKSAGPEKPAAANAETAALMAEIASALKPERDRKAAPSIEVRRTGAGTLISLTDDFDFSMFAVGSAEPHAKVVQTMEKIAAILKSRNGRIVVRGHTDGRPFRSDSYDNWRLSQARAQMALYMLVRGGLPEDRIVRVEGHADRDPRNTADVNADENRRIEILLQE